MCSVELMHVVLRAGRSYYHCHMSSSSQTTVNKKKGLYLKVNNQPANSSGLHQHTSDTLAVTFEHHLLITASMSPGGRLSTVTAVSVAEAKTNCSPVGLHATLINTLFIDLCSEGGSDCGLGERLSHRPLRTAQTAPEAAPRTRTGESAPRTS